MKKSLLLPLFAAILSLPAALLATSQDEDGPTRDNLSAFNPNNDTGVAHEAASDQVMARLSAPVLTNAGTTIDNSKSVATGPGSGSGCTWFKEPTLFVTNLFTAGNDQRPNGLDSTQYRLQIGGDFITKADFIAGAIYTYGLEQGEVDDVPAAVQDFDKTSHHLTLYTGKSLNSWLNIGATMDFGWSDTDLDTNGATNGVDAFSYSPSLFFGAAHAWDNWGFSSNIAYIYEDTYFDNGVNGGNTFNQSTGTVTWKTQGTWFAADWVDLSVFYKMTQIVHSNVETPLAGGNDHNWGTIGTKAVFYPCTNWEASVGLDYEVFNDDFEQTVTGLFGASYKF